MAKCRNCFTETEGSFCKNDCKTEYEKKYFGSIRSDNSENKTLSQYHNELPTFDEITKGNRYPKMSDLMNGEAKPTYQEALQALPTFEEIQFGSVLN